MKKMALRNVKETNSLDQGPNEQSGVEQRWKWGHFSYKIEPTGHVYRQVAHSAQKKMNDN